jgi:hypothetical protein
MPMYEKTPTNFYHAQQPFRSFSPRIPTSNPNQQPFGFGGLPQQVQQSRQGLLSKMLGKSTTSQMNMGGGFSSNPFQGSGGFPSMMSGMPGQPPAQTGGILSKLLGANGSAPGGGTDIASMVGNVQRVVNMTQQTLPMIQQYGPMVKNIPAMINMMKALNDTEDVDNSENEKKNRKDTNPNLSGESEHEMDDTFGVIPSNKTGQSTPKIYI